MDTDRVMAWVAEYERAWRADDVDHLDTLFTPHARYLHSPYDPPLDGLDAIRADWSDPTPFTMTATPVAVEGIAAVVRVLVRYGGDEPQEYLDLWVLRFAADGRVEHFEEWAYWPGKPYSAAAEVG
ncbi:nuclear transport factor 2 family protein [Cellulomonas hominis]